MEGACNRENTFVLAEILRKHSGRSESARRHLLEVSVGFSVSPVAYGFWGAFKPIVMIKTSFFFF